MSKAMTALVIHPNGTAASGVRSISTSLANLQKHVGGYLEPVYGYREADGSLLNWPTATIYVEGHCDERGSAEYNLGLGDRRATATREFLAQQGVPQDRLKTISFGKERPVCTEATEGCFQRNRRAHFASGQ